MTSKTITNSAIAFAAVVAFLTSTTKVGAQSCTTQYGGTVTCPPSYVVIDKQVWDPKAEQWVENLGVSQAFSTADKGDENSIIKFRLRVTNTKTDRTYKPEEITITDNFPYFLKLVSGRGTVNGDSVSFLNPEEIKPGETKEFGYEFQVKPAGEIPGPKAACASNVGVVKGADTSGNEDKAMVCFGEAGAKLLPVAGYSEFALIIPFIGMGASGLILATKRK